MAHRKEVEMRSSRLERGKVKGGGGLQTLQASRMEMGPSRMGNNGGKGTEGEGEGEYIRR